MAYPSQDLIYDILLRLPVKSLVRFRCLSKSFCTEIDGSTFINAHLTRSIETKTRRRLIVQQSGRLNKYTVVGLDELEQGRLLVVQEKQNNFPQRLIRGSCNGLVLLQHYVLDCLVLSLWNPFTRRIKKLPFVNPENPFYAITYLGFGYDCGTNDYKVVGIHGCYGYCTDVWVFSLVSNSWKKLLITCDSKFRLRSYDGIFAHGALHWLAYGIGNHPCCEIVTFDMSKEDFLPILQIKPQIISSNAAFAELVMPGHMLVWEAIEDGVEAKTIELFDMVKNGDCFAFKSRYNGSIKLNRISEKGQLVLDILELSKDGNKILMYATSGNNIGWYWYDLEKRSFESLNHHLGLPRLDHEYRNKVICCWESLVSLGADNQLI